MRNSRTEFKYDGAELSSDGKDRSQLKPILRKWVRLYRRHEEFHSSPPGGLYPKHSPYIFWERSAIGTFAAAVWGTKDGFAVEEYASMKNGGGGERTRGRTDLYFGLGSESRFIAEGKVRWIRIQEATRSDKSIGVQFCPEVSYAAHAASEDARRSEVDGHVTVGLAICNFWICKRECDLLDCEQKRALIRASVRKIKAQVGIKKPLKNHGGASRESKVVATAWVFAKNEGKWCNNPQDKLYFGSALFLSHIE